jgi:hypothetical protein
MGKISASLIGFLKSKPVRYAYFAILLAAAVFYLLKRRESLLQVLSTADMIQVILSWLACLGVNLVYFFIVQRIFLGLGAVISYKTTLKITSLAQLGKYLPLKVMYPTNFYLFSKEEGIPSDRIAVCFLLSAALSFLAGMICAAPAFFILAPSLRIILIGFIVMLVIVVHPRILTFLLHRIRSQTADQAGDVPDLGGVKLSYGLLARIMLLYLGNWCLAGLSLYFGLRALHPVGLQAFPFCLSAVALASTVGLIAFFAPAGIGVREAIGTVMLSRIVPVETAVLAMLVIRAGYLLADIGCGLLGMTIRKNPRR